MPFSSGPSPRLPPPTPAPPSSPSSPSPAAPAPAPSPGLGPFFLHAPASGMIRRKASATRHVHQALIATTFLRSGARASVQTGRPRRRGIIRRAMRQLFLGLSVAIGEEEMGAAGTRRGEDEVATVGGPGRVLVVARGRDRPRAAAVRARDHDLEAPRAGRPREPIALWRPRGRGVVVPGLRYPGRAAAVDAHHVDLRRAGARGAEGEVASVRRPDRRDVDRPVIGEPSQELPLTV